jgi:hypothetical protein
MRRIVWVAGVPPAKAALHETRAQAPQRVQPQPASLWPQPALLPVGKR